MWVYGNMPQEKPVGGPYIPLPNRDLRERKFELVMTSSS